MPEGLGIAPPDKETIEILEWIAARSVEQVNEYRVRTMDEIQKLAEHYIKTGEAQGWTEQGDDITQRIAKEVNGPLMEKLARRTGFDDTTVPHTFSQACELTWNFARNSRLSASRVSRTNHTGKSD